MAIVYETQLLEGLQLALQQANKTNTTVLFSSVVKIQSLSPLSFYASGREQYLGERLFWQEPLSKSAIVGLGKVERIQTNPNNHRFFNIEKEWKLLIENSVIHSEGKIPATGPILFGGFSFDEEKSQSLLWDHFGDSFFYVPQYMITNVDNQTYFTTNLLCTPNGNIKRYMEIIEQGELLRQTCNDVGPFNENPFIEKMEIEPEQWKSQVAKAVQTLKKTDMDKIVLARELRVKYQNQISSDAVLERLLNEQASSYIYSLESGKDCFIGASPERLVKKENENVLSTCLAGSIARGKTNEEDKQLGDQLLNDPKNLIEHQYVVGMIKNTLQSECSQLEVPNKPVLMKTKHIQHLYTPVTAKCEKGKSILNLVKKLHPTPALGGLPKQAAVEWIRENESLERGLYGGPIGWIDSYGNGEFAVALRSALLQGEEASLFAGCGIVEDSIPEEEYKETWIKFKPMLNALGGSPS